MALPKVAVLVSGSGSNLQALLDATASGACAAEIALVLSNRPGVRALTRAQNAGVDNIVIDHGDFADRTTFDRAIDQAMRDRQIDLVCLAGFMRILGAEFVESWRDRILNIHPSLLPAFKGLNTHERALATGVRVAGCTVHLVRPDLDDGPIIVQGIVPVHAGDSAEELASRVLEMEHLCYPKALDLLARGLVTVISERANLAEPFNTLLVHPLLIG